MATTFKVTRGLLLIIFIISGCTNGTSTSKSEPKANTASFAAVLPENNPNAADDTAGDEVFVCKSTGAKKYHIDKDCRGLNRCKHKIEKTTKKAAEAMGLGLCGYED